MKRSTRRVIIEAVMAGFFAMAFGFPVCAQTKYDHVEYLKAAQQGEKKKGETVGGALNFDATKKTIEFLDKSGAAVFTIPDASVKGLHYEKTSRPRYAEALLIAWPLIFTKSKKHYLTIQYTDAAGAGQFSIIHLDKNNYQQILATAEAQTGIKVERAEEK